VHSSPMIDQMKRDEIQARFQRAGIESMCEEYSTTFVDDEFLPSQQSVGELHQDRGSAIPGKLHSSELVWLRPTVMNREYESDFEWTVFNDPNSCDIIQGYLGDCWLMSALAMVAERPDVLEKIFLTKVYSKIGLYQVRLCVDGVWRVITVDDFFPCRQSSRSFAFAYGRNKQLWVPLVEKAFAKALGKYERLRTGTVIEGFALLTGAPCESISLEDDDLDKDLLWATLKSASEAGFIMGASCGAGGKQRIATETSQSHGLRTRHAYSVLDVRQEGCHRLIRLRNPWGRRVWIGDWSDNWSGWPADLKRRLLPPGEHSPGAFWMPYADFLLHFYRLELAKLRDHLNWAELRVPCKIGGSWTNEAVALMLIIEEPTEMCCSLFREGSRSDSEHDDLFISVHRLSPQGQVGELEMRSSRNLKHMVSTGDFFIRPGHYIILPMSISSVNRGSVPLNGSLVVHSNKQLFGETVKCPPQMATDALVQLTLKEGEEHQIYDGVVARTLSKQFGGLLVMVDNFSDSHAILTTDCT
ncbi:hypothetical protein PFISCL1PPCAC_7333, partial [Pristionchus fissidentatus]